MKSSFLIFSILIFSHLSFSSNPGNKMFYQDEQKVKTVVLTPSNFEKNAHKYIGRKVEITGIVDHICKHGGKKMFLVDQKSNGMVKITANDNMAAFTQELVGETVKVTGVVEVLKVDENYINKMESKAEKGIKQKGEGLHVEGENNIEHESTDQSDKIQNLRKMLEESGKDYISFFSIQATGYEVVK